MSCFTGKISVPGTKPETCSQSLGHHTKALVLSVWTYSFRLVPNHQKLVKYLEKFQYIQCATALFLCGIYFIFTEK